MGFLFEKLDVYWKAIELADEINKLAISIQTTRDFPIANQLRRASISIPLNIAEGNGRYLSGDRKRFFVIARGSGFELVAILELAVRRGYLEHNDHRRFRNELVSICRMLTTMSKRE